MFILCQTEYQIHRLSYEHFKFLNSLHHTGPFTLVTTVMGILSFVVGSKYFSEKISTTLSLVAGILSFVLSALQQIAKVQNFGPRADMHLQATVGLRRLSAQLASDISEDPNQVGGSLVPKKEKQQEEVKTYRQVLNQCLESCNSATPIAIRHVFNLVETRFSITSLSDDRIQQWKQAHGEPAILELSLYHTMINELFYQFTSRWFWYWFLPDSDKVYEDALKKVNELIQ